MSYRCLMIVNPARIRCKNEQLLIETEEVHSVPIEDISAIVLESRQSTITTAALAALAQNGVVTFWCDETHLPCGISLPFAQHSRQLGVLRWQMELTLPAKKRMWQQIVTAKIKNQAECLALCGKTQEAAFLFGRAKAVTSGDKDNLEASAAAYYFPALFGTGYTRRNEDTRNAALNYAYAILRGYMARCLAVYGFLPYLGLHHDSELNQFNLADDLMEPFRPVADLYVAANVAEDAALTTALKGQLVNLLNADILSGNQHHSVAYAMERMVQSLIIPYQELLGNYDFEKLTHSEEPIIPYQELLGNYDVRKFFPDRGWIIPYQELLGNYDSIKTDLSFFCIIPYQELLGNYDPTRALPLTPSIIPYQELLGNYDTKYGCKSTPPIIPYQELLGNYD